MNKKNSVLLPNERDLLYLWKQKEMTTKKETRGRKALPGLTKISVMFPETRLQDLHEFVDYIRNKEGYPPVSVTKRRRL